MTVAAKLLAFGVGALTIVTMLTAGLDAEAAPTRRLPLAEGQTYQIARERLLSQGWKPQVSSLRYATGELKRDFGDAAIMVSAGYIEILDCSGTGTNICEFGWRKEGTCLLVVTRGEIVAHSHFPTVSQWRLKAGCASVASESMFR